MKISVASGKGGTGKTTVALNMAISIEEQVNLLDVDVEEPNCHIFLPGSKFNSENVYSYIPEVDLNKCSYCGKCAEICRFNAIAVLSNNVMVFKELCHCCGGCAILCPEKAISETKIQIGSIKTANIFNLNFYYGELKIGHPTAPPVIKAVKKYIEPEKINIIDCPPGTSCAAVESIKGSDFCIMVSDPTPFGIHDLKLSVKVLQQLNVPFGVVINKCDTGTDELYKYCSSHNITILMEIKDERRIAEIYSQGKLIVNELPEYKNQFNNLFNTVKELIK
ncbi:MAG: ATP-binding protein [Cyanobacteriota bacterium]